MKNAQTFRNFHFAYRFYRSKGLGKIDSLRTVQQQHPDLNRAYCEGQERGEAWTREPLDAKDEARTLQIRTTGRLI
jgi:hypothetical protein